MREYYYSRIRGFIVYLIPKSFQEGEIWYKCTKQTSSP